MGIKYVQRADRVAFRAYGDRSGGVLLDLETSLYFGVNSVGALIWELIGSGTDVTQIVHEMQAKFEDIPPTLSDDVEEFINELSQRQLVILGEPSAKP